MPSEEEFNQGEEEGVSQGMHAIIASSMTMIPRDVTRTRRCYVPSVVKKDINEGQYKSTVPKCLNCGGDHKTLAAKCQVRKNLIKEKRKESVKGCRCKNKYPGAD